MMFRPMRPKPLIPTLMGILPPNGVGASGRATLQTSATLRNLKCYGLRQQKSTRVKAGRKLSSQFKSLFAGKGSNTTKSRANSANEIIAIHHGLSTIGNKNITNHTHQGVRDHRLPPDLVGIACLKLAHLGKIIV